MEINKEYELNALLRILGAIRYKIMDDSVSELALSPITTELFNRVVEGFSPFLKKRGVTLNYGYIEEEPKILCVIKSHLSNIETWSQLDQSLRQSIILNLVQPYQITEETLDELTLTDVFVLENLSEEKYSKYNLQERVYIADFLDDFIDSIITKNVDKLIDTLKKVDRDEESIKVVLNSFKL